MAPSDQSGVGQTNGGVPFSNKVLEGVCLAWGSTTIKTARGNFATRFCHKMSIIYLVYASTAMSSLHFGGKMQAPSSISDKNPSRSFLDDVRNSGVIYLISLQGTRRCYLCNLNSIRTTPLSNRCSTSFAPLSTPALHVLGGAEWS